mmetsp:Transcript_19932/g.40284  ORF Transcript_19932/g.40284 Transcript_19932/m.40284 type:complete len:186 (-) Transcript_19932:296-853(-)
MAKKVSGVAVIGDCVPSIESIAPAYPRKRSAALARNRLFSLGRVTCESPRLIWVPGHCGVEGNEIAHKLARRGAELSKARRAAMGLAPPPPDMLAPRLTASMESETETSDTDLSAYASMESGTETETEADTIPTSPTSTPDLEEFNSYEEMEVSSFNGPPGLLLKAAAWRKEGRTGVLGGTWVYL